jgi:hypothetical protein
MAICPISERGRRNLDTRHGGCDAAAPSAAALKSFFDDNLIKTMDNEGFVDRR